MEIILSETLKLYAGVPDNFCILRNFMTLCLRIAAWPFFVVQWCTETAQLWDWDRHRITSRLIFFVGIEWHPDFHL